MAVSTKHVVAQRHVIGALARAVALGAIKKPTKAPSVPGPEVRAVVPPPSDELVSAFVRLVKGDPGAYKKHLPPHLFPHWAFPSVLRALEGVPYPTAKIVNGGCTLTINERVPKGEPIQVSARLAEIDDNGRRAILKVNVVTSTPSVKDALVAEFRCLVPLGGGKGEKKKGADDRPRIDTSAREIAYFKFAKNAGLDFAKATGDFNPIHWVPSYARMMGFKSVILHGFGSLSWSFEGLARGVFSGDVHRIAMLDANFVRPLVLPGKAGLYVWGTDQVGLGEAPGSPAYMLGRYRARS
jgi:hypothetical protein